MTIQDLFIHLNNHLLNKNLKVFSDALQQYLQIEGHTVDDVAHDSTLFSAAALAGDLEVCQLLIKHHANIESKNSAGSTPLILATVGHHAAVVKLLVEKGASLDSATKRGRTPLIQATIRGYVELVKILLDNGASLNIKDNQGDNAFAWAAYRGHEEITQLLIDKKGEVEPYLKMSPQKWHQEIYISPQSVVYKMLKNAGRFVLPFSNDASRYAKANRTRHNNLVQLRANAEAKGLADTPLNRDVARLVFDYLSVDANVHKIFENVFMNTKSILFAAPQIKNQTHEKPASYNNTPSKRIKYK